MKIKVIRFVGAIIFPLLFSACVSQNDTVAFNKQRAAKARVELALGYLQQNNLPQAKQNLDKALEHDKNYYLVFRTGTFLSIAGGCERRAPSLSTSA